MYLVSISKDADSGKFGCVVQMLILSSVSYSSKTFYNKIDITTFCTKGRKYHKIFWKKGQILIKILYMQKKRSPKQPHPSPQNTPPKQTLFALFRPISVLPPIPEFRLIRLIFLVSQGIRVTSTVGQPYVISGVCQNKSQASICLVHQETDGRPQQSMLQKNHASQCLWRKCLI